MKKPTIKPYVGPRTFEETERDRFFGREREARELLALTVSERLVLFYAQSGAGKSSLINTCLTPDLRKKGFEVFPVVRVGGDIPLGMEVDNIFVFNLIRILASNEFDAPSLAKLSLSDFFAKHKKYTPSDSTSAEAKHGSARRILIVDQFEELFSTHHDQWEKRGDFFAQLAQVMEDEPYLSVVLVMREDYIASLDPYAALVAGKLRMRYYMQRLGQAAALEAIKTPVKNLRPYAPGVAEKLVKDLCSIKVQKPDGTLGTETGQYVEPVQLQVVCYSLWENLRWDDLPAEGAQITEEDTKDVGDVDMALGRYYADRVKAVAGEKRVKERRIRQWFGDKLIAAGGIRNLVLAEPNKKSGELDDDVIQALQSDLVRAEKRGGATWYELTHDRLVEPILADNRVWFDEHSSPLQRQARLWIDQGRTANWLSRDQALVDIIRWAEENKDEVSQSEKEFLDACIDQRDQIEKERTIERMKEEQERELQQQKLEAAQRLAEEQARSAQQERELQTQKLEAARKLAEEQARSAQRARGQTRLAYVLLGLAVIAIGFAFWASVQANSNADKARALESEANDVADAASARELAAQADSNLSKQLDLSILLGLAAYDKNFENFVQSEDPNKVMPAIIPQVQKNLVDIMQSSLRLREYLATSQDPARQIQYSPNGEMLAVLKEYGIVLSNLNDPSMRTLVAGSETVDPDHYLFTPDGASLVYLNYKGLNFWDVNKREIAMEPINGHNGAVVQVVFSAQGESFATVGENGEVSLWDAGDRSLIGPLLHAEAVTVSPDRQEFATLDRDGKITRHSMLDGSQLGDVITRKPGTITSLAFDQAGDFLALGGTDGEIVLWDLINNKEYDNFRADTKSAITDLYFNSDGKFLVYNADTGTDVFSLESYEKRGDTITGAIKVSPSGKALAVVDQSGQIILHDIPESSIPKTVGGTFCEFSLDGESLAVFNLTDKSLNFINVSTGDPSGEPVVLDLESPPSSMAFSRDGNWLAIGATDGSIIVVDITARKAEFTDRTAENPVVSLTFKPDAEAQLALVGGSGDGSLILWNPGNQVVETVPTGFEGRIDHIYLSPGGKYIYSVARDGVVLTDLDTLESTRVFPGDDIKFSPRENIVAMVDDVEDKYEYTLWDLSTEKILGTAISGTDLVFSPEGGKVAVMNLDDHKITIWEGATGYQIGSPIEGNTAIFSADEKRLFSIDDASGNVTLWDTATGAQLGNTIPGNYVYPAPKGTTAVVSDYNGHLTILDASTAEIIGDMVGYSFPSSYQDGELINFSPDGELLLVYETETGNLIFWDIAAKEPRGGSVPYGDISLSADKRMFAITSYYNTTLWDFATGTTAGDLPPGYNFRFGPDGNTAILQEYSGYTSIWNLSKVEKIAELTNQNFLDFSPQGTYILMQDNYTAGLNLWSIPAGIQVGGYLTGNSGRFDAMPGVVQAQRQESDEAFVLSPNEETYATISSDGSVGVWNLKTAPSIPGETLQGLSDQVDTTALSPDGDTLALSTSESITIWNVETGLQLGELPNTHVENPLDVEISANGTTLAIVNNDNTLSLWNADTSRPIGERIHGTFYTFSPDSRILITTQDYREYTLWDSSSGLQVGEPLMGDSLQFSRDGKFLLLNNPFDNNTLVYEALTGASHGEPIEGSFVGLGSDPASIIVNDGKSVRVWDVSTGKTIGNPIGIGENSYYYNSSPDGRYLEFTTVDGQIAVWDMETSSPVDTTKDFPGDFRGFSPDGRIICLYSYEEGGLVLYETEDLTHRIVEKAVPGDYPEFSLDGNFVNVTSYYYNQDISIYSTATGEKINTSHIPGSFMSFGENGDLLLTLTEGNKINLWRTDDITREPETLDYAGLYSGLAVSGDGSTLAIYGNKGTLVYALSAPEQLQNPIGEKTGTVDTMVFSPDGRKLATIGTDGLILWDVQKLQQIGSIVRSEKGVIWSVIFSPDNQSVAYLDESGAVFVLGTDAAALVEDKQSSPLHTNVCEIGFNQAGELMAVEQNGEILQIRNLKSDQVVAEPDVPVVSCDNSMAFSGDGTSFAYNSADRIYLFTSDDEGAQPFSTEKVIFGDQFYYYDLDFVAGNKFIAARGYDFGALFLWDVESRSLVFASEQNSELNAASNGETLFYLPTENQAVMMDFAPEILKKTLDDWKQLLCDKVRRNLTRAEWEQYIQGDEYPAVQEAATCSQWPLEMEITSPPTR